MLLSLGVICSGAVFIMAFYFQSLLKMLTSVDAFFVQRCWTFHSYSEVKCISLEICLFCDGPLWFSNLMYTLFVTFHIGVGTLFLQASIALQSSANTASFDTP